MELNTELSDLENIESSLSFLKHNNIYTNEIIFVGGTVFEHLGLRPAADIDIIVTQKKRMKLEAETKIAFRGTFEAININENIQVLKNPYRYIGISDADCFDKKYYHEVDIGSGNKIKIILPELEFGKKLFRKRPKDQQDVLLLQKHALSSNNWRWDLVPVSPVKEKQNKQKPIYKRPKDLLLKSIRGVFKPIESLRYIKKTLKNKFLNNSRPAQLKPHDLGLSVIDIGTLVQWQFNEYVFCRYDTLLRILVLKTFLNQPNSHNGDDEKHGNELEEVFAHYEKMQKERVDRFTRIQFEELINSIRRKGFQTDKFPIKLDSDGRLIDGSHRFASALCLGVDRIPVQFLPKKKGPVNYGRDWFEQRGFPGKLLAKLDNELNELLLSTGAAFVLILWPPAQQFTDEVKETIASRYPIIAEATHKTIPEFSKFIEAVYLSDDIEEWKIQKKIYHMKAWPPEISAIAFLIDKPGYRTKTRTESYLSDTVAALKKEIRDKYRKQIDGYVHDIVIHIGDNPSMNREMVVALKEHNVSFTMTTKTAVAK